MTKSYKKGIFYTLLFALSTHSTGYAQNKMKADHFFQIDMKGLGIKIQPTMYGIFFEDINYAADGGLYGELIKNRSFEFDQPLMGWSQPQTYPYDLNKKTGYIDIVRSVKKANHNYIHVNVNDYLNYSLINEGYHGIGLHTGEQYTLSFMAANDSGRIKEVHFSLIDTAGNVIANATVNNLVNSWASYSCQFTVPQTVEHAKLKITFSGNGGIDMDMVSLFPKHTWKNRPNGLRNDIAQRLAALHPGFIRFPGGCIVEGRNLSQRYQWKKTVLPVADRETIINRWNNEVKNRPAPDYYQSFGLGFFEYFQFAEDIKAKPLPILNCGMSCQFNAAEKVAMDDLDPYIQDALDLIEFANGDPSSQWGKLRAELGHAQPFNLEMIGVGNEQWGPQYIERYKKFAKAIKSKYPRIKIVSGSGPAAEGDFFDYGWSNLKKLNADIVDEHYYNKADWFLKNTNRYDSYDRNGPKVFAGEYAAQSDAITSPTNRNNWGMALAEAAYMTGLERNADVVYMTSYAPLLAHKDGWQWKPDLIWFDNLSTYATPNYFVQQLYSTNKGTDLLRLTENNKPIEGQDSLYATASIDRKSKELIIKIVNAGSKEQHISFNSLNGKITGKGKLISLAGNDLDAENSFDKENIHPEEVPIDIHPERWVHDIPGHTFHILRLDVRLSTF